MRIKSYFAGTIREAINQARKELGPDAMIIASRKTDGENTSRGDYEVVCGLLGDTAPAAPASAPAAPPPERKRPDQAPAAASRSAGDDFVTHWIDKIRNAGRRKPDNLETVAADIRARLTTAPELGRPHSARKVIALVGPPGAGKTTTTVKLAVKYGLMARRPMHLISMDGYRVAGADSLRTYAAAMGISFDALDTAASLAHKLDEHNSKGIVLIDTPGLGSGDMVGSTHLASFLSKNREIDVQLVLPATMSLPDMSATFERFRSWVPQKLIFTGVDMTCSVAPLLSLAMEAEKPISFLGVGQQIPEDLEEANVEDLIRRAMPEARKSAISAA